MTINLVHPRIRSALANMIVGSGMVLDIGCGPGQYKEVLGERYIGMDLTTERYKDEISRGTDIIGDAQWIPLATDTLDAAFSVETINQVPDIGQAISEVFRVLKSGGRFLLFDYNWRTLRRLAKTELGAIAADREYRIRCGVRRVVNP